jgi:ribosomal subunit interface protein
MQLTVTGKQLDVGDSLRDHVADSLAGLFDKYFGNAIEATVVLSREAHRYRAQISAHVGRNITMASEAAAEAPYAAFDSAAEHLGKRLRRHKRRLRDHHRQPVEAEPAQQYVLAAGDEASAADEPGAGDAPAIIAEMATEVPTLSVGEAVMRLDLADGGAIMFRNRAHGGLNMVYRRPDGNVGWVDPQGNRPARSSVGR